MAQPSGGPGARPSVSLVMLLAVLPCTCVGHARGSPVAASLCSSYNRHVSSLLRGVPAPGREKLTRWCRVRLRLRVELVLMFGKDLFKLDLHSRLRVAAVVTMLVKSSTGDQPCWWHTMLSLLAFSLMSK